MVHFNLIRFREILSFKAMIANRCNQRDRKHKNKYNTAFFYHILVKITFFINWEKCNTLYENNLDISKKFQQDRDFIIHPPSFFLNIENTSTKGTAFRVLYLSTTRLKSEMRKLYLVSYLKMQHVKALKGRHFLSEIEA